MRNFSKYFSVLKEIKYNPLSSHPENSLNNVLSWLLEIQNSVNSVHGQHPTKLISST